jgi:hypothetical protein
VSGLLPATLQRLKVQPVGPPKKGKAKATPVGKALPVQFNPASLRITRRNNVDRAGVTTQTQKAQSPSAERASLAFDLEFDTAEQVSSGTYVDVRQWTALVRQFVEPPPDSAGEAPPAVQFAWGTLVFNGIVDQVTEELDYFAPDGTPLHAKVSLNISEQDFTLDGAAARTSAKAVEPGAGDSGIGPGETPTAPFDQVVQARNNESAQQLMTRVGLDPTAWRAAMAGLDNPLGLAPGQPVQIATSATRAGSLGNAAQFGAGPGATAPESLAQALGPPGLRPTEGPAVSTPAGKAEGMALAAAGGIAAAAQQVEGSSAAARAEAARAGFDVPPPAAIPPPISGTSPGPPGVPDPRRGTPLDAPPGSSRPSTQALDPRATTYGAAVPLQARARPAPPRPEASAPWESGGADMPAPQRTGDGRPRWWTPGGECR